MSSEFCAICLDVFNILNSDIIMFEIESGELLCINKQEFLKYITNKHDINISCDNNSVSLTENMLNIIEKNINRVNILHLSTDGIIVSTQLKLFDKREEGFVDVSANKNSICQELQYQGGRTTISYDNFIVKTDEKKILDDEVNVYKKLAHPAIFNILNPHFSILYARGTCDNGTNWIAIEKASEGNLYNFLKNNNFAGISVSYNTVDGRI